MTNDTETTHPRTLGWVGTAALALGGSSQGLLLIAGATGLVASHGGAAVPLLALGLLLAWMAAPGWTEMVLMWPDRVGGIAATCAGVLKPYSPVLANLTGACYWWGRVPMSGLAALLAASAIHHCCLPSILVPVLAIALVAACTGVNLCGVQWTARLAIPAATASAALALVSGLLPVLTHHVDWRQAATFSLAMPFPGIFGSLTGAMAGLYLIGLAAPAFEAAACHVGEMADPVRNVPRAMRASALMALVYCVLLPTVWHGVLGTSGLTHDLALSLGPTFAPLLGGASKAAAVWFITFSLLQGTLQPLAGASRTLSQMAEDGLLPRVLARRSRTDVPWVATLVTAGMATVFLLAGGPTWMLAAAGLTFLIGIALPSVAVWLLRRDAPHIYRPYRAPDWTIPLGVAAAAAWAAATALGLEQFGLRAVLLGLALIYSGPALYALRRRQDRAGASGVRLSLHTKLTGAMLLVMALNGAAYLLAGGVIGHADPGRTAALGDIFVAVALLTVTVGLVLPGAISHAVEEVVLAANRLACGTLADFSHAMRALGEGRLEDAHARVDVSPILVHPRNDLAALAGGFNRMQDEIVQAAKGLEGARKGLRDANIALKTRMAELRTSRARFEFAVRGSRDGLWDWDVAHGTVYFSPRWKAMLGYADEEMPNVISEWEGRVHADDRERFQETLQGYLKGALSDYEIEFRMQHRDGGVRWILARGTALRDAEGRAYRMAGSHTDITDRKRAEEEQLRLANYNRLLLESSGEGVYGIDTDGRCTFINQAGARLLGVAPGAIMGRKMHEMTHHSHADGAPYPLAESPIHRAATQGLPCRVDSEVFWRADRTHFAVEYSSSPIRENGIVQGAVVTFVDITARRRAQMELLRAKLAAEAASVAKSQFLANHEPRAADADERHFRASRRCSRPRRSAR